MKLFAPHQSDFFHRFQAVCHEARTENVQFRYALFRQFVKQNLRTRFNPFRLAELALEGDDIFLLSQSQGFGKQFGRMAAFVGIRVALVVLFLRYAVKLSISFSPRPCSVQYA